MENETSSDENEGNAIFSENGTDFSSKDSEGEERFRARPKSSSKGISMAGGRSSKSRKLSSRKEKSTVRKTRDPSEGWVKDSDNLKFNRPNGVEVQITELREQLVALKVRNCQVEAELTKVKADLRKERQAFLRLNDDQLDIEHDLSETKRINYRLEKENSLLRKKLSKREGENERLLLQIQNSTGAQHDDTIVSHSYHNASFENEGASLNSSSLKSPKLTKEQRRNIWGLLADETLPEAHSSNRSMNYGGSVLENFIRNTTSLTHLNDHSQRSFSPKPPQVSSTISLSPTPGGTRLLSASTETRASSSISLGFHNRHQQSQILASGGRNAAW